MQGTLLQLHGIIPLKNKPSRLTLLWTISLYVNEKARDLLSLYPVLK